MIAKPASRSLPVLCLGVLSLGALAQSTASKQLPSPQAIANYGKLPLAFEPNRGQTSGNVQWLARGAPGEGSAQGGFGHRGVLRRQGAGWQAEQLGQARERGDERAARNAEEAITARRAWLAEAEHTLAEFTS